MIDSPANPTERGRIEERLYDQTRLIEIADIIGGSEGDIEDLIAVDDYLAAFNTSFSTAFTTAHLTSKDPRIVRRIEQAHGPYNHGDVGREVWVRERAAGRLNVSEATKNTFEKLFKRINATLATSSWPSEPNPAIAIFAEQLADGTITQDKYEEDHPDPGRRMTTCRVRPGASWSCGTRRPPPRPWR